MSQGNLVVCKSNTGAIELPVDATNETVWASQKQIAEVFGVDRGRITRYINNIIDDGEVDDKSNVRKTHIANGLYLL